MILLDVALALLALPVFLASAYLFFLTVLSFGSKAPLAPQRRFRFDIIVPAHNEELGIAQTVQSLRALDYPSELRRIWVVADNCQDQTAKVAEAAGAQVIVRNDLERRGKGYALELAFDRSSDEGWADAVVVVDADTLVEKNLLDAFSARLALGAHAIQAEYGVSNRDASWRTRLLSIAFSLFHDVRSMGRERLQVSCGLRGNGMCFSREATLRVPHRAFSLVEDLEYGIRLGEAGYRVHYAWEAKVFGQMAATEKASRSQRKRWEGGRLAMAKVHGKPLLARALADRSAVLFDLALDLLVPPLSYVVLAAALGLGVSLVVGHMPLSLGLFGLSLFFLGVYIVRGWWVSGVGPRGLFDLLFAPLYMVWKLLLWLRRPEHAKGEWVRTAREGESPTVTKTP
jgi:cellulose synthase/poly-beta-1,6-N-acetylglucosamine synthase-like glycosyltransferase